MKSMIAVMAKGLGLFAALGFAASAAQAVHLLDFAGEAAGNERSVEGDIILFGDVYVEFDANDNNFAYLDDVSNGRPAGLGVCQNLDGGTGLCTPSNDDNITAGEAVTISFFSDALGASPLAGDLFGLTFRDADHFDITSSTDTLMITTSAAGQTEYTFASAAATVFSGITWITFAYGGRSPDQFYLNGVFGVPEPSILLLMGSSLAFGGLAARRRRRRTA